MFGQASLGSSRLNSADNRMFRYEVEGMRQTYENDQLSYPIRSSGSFFVTVPYSRMNEEMQRILRMGGKIVSIQPLSLDGDHEAKMQSVTAQQNLEAEGKSKATEAQSATAAKTEGQTAAQKG